MSGFIIVKYLNLAFSFLLSVIVSFNIGLPKHLDLFCEFSSYL